MGVASARAATDVEVRDADTGRLVASGHGAHPISVDRGEQDPSIWWDALADAVNAAGSYDIGAIAVAGQRQGLVLVDGAGAPLAPASLRGDERAAPLAAGVVKRLGAERLARATGHVPGADTPFIRLAWLLDRDPALVERLVGVLSAHDHLTSRLTGRRVTDRGGASGTGCWSPTDGRWRLDVLERVARPAPAAGWEAVLPTVLAPDEPADSVSATVHDLLGLRGRPVVAAGTGDLMASALATAVPDGWAAALLIDDGAVVTVTDTAPADATGTVQGFAGADGKLLPAVPVLDAEAALAGVARLLRTDADGLARMAASATGDPADGPVVVPAARNGPGGRPVGSVGGVLGVGPSTTPEAVARAALLGIAATILDAVDALAPDGPEGLVLAGGGAGHPGLALTVATLLGWPVSIGRTTAAPVLGAAVQAAAVLHARPPAEVAAAWGLGGRTEVEPGRAVDTNAIRQSVREASKLFESA